MAWCDDRLLYAGIIFGNEVDCLLYNFHVAMSGKCADLVEDAADEECPVVISNANDESDRDGMRIVIDIKRDANASVVLNKLYKMTALQTSFGVNNVALVHGRPKTLNLRDLIKYFIEHRHEVVIRRTQFDLRKAQTVDNKDSIFVKRKNARTFLKV